MLLNQRTNVLFSEPDYKMLKELSTKNNQSIGDLIRHAVNKTYKPKKKTQAQLFNHLRELGKNANTKGINYKQLVEDGHKY